MKNNRSPFLIFGIAALLFLSACHPPKDLVFKEFKNLTIDQLSFSGAALKVDLVYYNPNNFGLQLNRTDLDVFLDSTFLGHSSQNIQVAIPKRDNFTIPLKVNLDVKNLLKNGITSFFNRNVNVRVMGSVKLGKGGVYKSFPVDYTSVQNFSMFR
ncbi:MAG: LEA type 2 family protein [Ferruginibacter sp.]